MHLKPDVRKRVWKTARRLDAAIVATIDCGRKPRTMCACIVYLALQRERVNVHKKTVAQACAVCPQTLDKVLAQVAGVI